MKKKYQNYKDIKIGVYAICADEPTEFIDRWLESMKGADYTYVLVTKQDNPNTEYFAEKQNLNDFYGKLIVMEMPITPWRFDVARNESLKMVNWEEVDVAVCTDIDEILDERFWNDLRKTVFEHPDFDRVFYKYAWSHQEDGTPDLVFWYDKIHREGYKWQFPVHESLYKVSGEEDTKTFLLNEGVIYLHHYPDKSKSRSSYLPLLEQRAKEYPTDLSGLYYLAREYSFVGQFEKTLTIALGLYNKLLLKRVSGTLTSGDESMLGPVCLMIGESYESLGIDGESEYWYSKSVSYAPAWRISYIRLIQRKIYDGKTEEAKMLIGNMEKNSQLTYDWRDVPWAWRDWKKCQMLGDIALWQGQIQQARLFFDLACADLKDSKDRSIAEAENFFEDLAFLQDKEAKNK